jgi:hemerythrin-like metal-binding protein/PAS domain S-box-containing protein
VEAIPLLEKLTHSPLKTLLIITNKKMVHVEKIVVKGKTYYKLVHSVRKDGKVKGISKYLGKELPPPKILDKLKREFLEEIIQKRESAKQVEEKKENQQKFVKSLDKQYLTPMQSSFQAPEESDTILLSTPSRFREVLKNLNEVVYIADPNTFLTTYVSPSIVDLFGYTHVEWGADSTLLEKLIHPKDREEVLKKLKKVLEEKSQFNMQYRINTRREKTIWVEHKIIWEKDSQGYITALIGIFKDVTLKQETEDQIKLMYDDSPVAMMEMDFSTVKHYLKTYNLKTKKDIWGRFSERPHELSELHEMMQIVSLNKSVLSLFKAKDKKSFMKIFYKKAFFRDSNEVFIKELMAVAEGQQAFESKLNIFSMDGRRIQVVLKWYVPNLYKESYNKVLVTYVDTAYQREMGKVMNVKNYAIESSPGATVITDLEGRITYANPAFLTLWNVENLGEIMNKLIMRYFPDEKKATEIFHNIHLQEKWQGEIILGKGKQKEYLRSNGMVVRDSFDEPIAIVFSFIDITEVRKSEQIRLEFTNIAAHELKTPLVPLKTLLTMIYEEPQQFGVNKQGMRHLTVCMRNVNRLNVLIGDILDISRLEAGGMKFKESKYKLQDVVKEVANNFKETVEKKGVHLRLKVPEKLPQLFGDAQKISQVLGNLVKNAVNFTDQGSILIKVSVKGVEIQVDVIDTGIGINKNSQPKLFTKFYQVQDITTRRSKGSGLGLAISKGIIEHHGGKMFVFSEGKGNGSTFSFTLPIKSVHHHEKERKVEETKLIGDQVLLEGQNKDKPSLKKVSQRTKSLVKKAIKATEPKSEKKSLPAIKWTKDISVGDQILDNQHKELLTTINKLVIALNENKEKQIIRSIVGFLSNYITEHLRYEEEYMLKHDYPGFEQHQKIHERFIEIYLELKEKLNLPTKNNQELANEVLSFLGKWWIDHIKKEDHKYYEYIKAHPNSEKMMQEANGTKEKKSNTTNSNKENNVQKKVQIKKVKLAKKIEPFKPVQRSTVKGVVGKKPGARGGGGEMKSCCYIW